MTTAYSTNLGLALPVQGELSGTWGDMVNYGITDYLDIAVAGTLTLSGDGAVTLANTNGTSAGTNIGSTTAQYAVLKITGTLTAIKVITAPSTSKVYVVNNAATGYAVTVKASGQTGVSIAVGEKAVVWFNGTDYVKIATSYPDVSGATGTLPIANGGTASTTAADARTALAAAGTGTANTFTGTQTLSGSSTTVGAVLKNAAETATVSATAAASTVNYNVLSQSVLYYTSNATGNWTLNARGDGTTPLSSLIDANQSVTFTHFVTNGSTAYYNNLVQIDGSTTNVTTKWLNGAPTYGNINSIDVYAYTVVKTSSLTTPHSYTVFASQTTFF